MLVVLTGAVSATVAFPAELVVATTGETIPVVVEKLKDFPEAGAPPVVSVATMED